MMRRLAFALFVALALSACSKEAARDAPPGLCACESAAPVVDATLVAFLSKARAAHHKADLAESGGDLRAAIAVLDGLASGPRPGGKAPLPEVTEVVADTRARLADLRSAAGDFDAAASDVADGLTLAATPTHFRGHLLEVRGVVEERRSKALKEKGDLPGAERAKQDAIRSFEAAIETDDQVIERALGDGGAR